MRPQNAKIFHTFKMSLLTEQNLQHNRSFVLRPSIPLLLLHYSSIVYASNIAFWKMHLGCFFAPRHYKATQHQCVQIWHANVTHTTQTAVRTWEWLRAQCSVSALRSGFLSFLCFSLLDNEPSTRENSENHCEQQTHYAARATILTYVLLLALCA